MTLHRHGPEELCSINRSSQARASSTLKVKFIKTSQPLILPCAHPKWDFAARTDLHAFPQFSRSAATHATLTRLRRPVAKTRRLRSKPQSTISGWALSIHRGCDKKDGNQHVAMELSIFSFIEQTVLSRCISNTHKVLVLIFQAIRKTTCKNPDESVIVLYTNTELYPLIW